MIADKQPISPAARTARSGRLAAVIRWHRRIGVGLAVIFVAVVITGMLLNHAEGLGLRHRTLNAEWLHRWYGMVPAAEPVAFRVGAQWAVGLERMTIVGSSAPLQFGPLVGATDVDGLVAIAAAEELALLTTEGELVERVGSGLLPPGRIEAVGTDSSGKRLLVRTDQGIHATDTTLAGWAAPAESQTARWNAPQPVPAELRDRLMIAWRGDGITVHRLVLDLHSGRFFGRFGVLVVDLGGIALLLLVLTGVWFAIASSRQGGKRS